MMKTGLSIESMKLVVPRIWRPGDCGCFDCRRDGVPGRCQSCRDEDGRKEEQARLDATWTACSCKAHRMTYVWSTDDSIRVEVCSKCKAEMRR